MNDAIDLSGQIKSNVRLEIGEKLGAEAQRAAEVADMAEAPWDIEMDGSTIHLNLDERAILMRLKEGAFGWPEGSLEDGQCEWLADHGLAKRSSGGKFSLTKKGKAMAAAIDEKNAEVRSAGTPDFFGALSGVEQGRIA